MYDALGVLAWVLVVGVLVVAHWASTRRRPEDGRCSRALRARGDDVPASCGDRLTEVGQVAD